MRRPLGLRSSERILCAICRTIRHLYRFGLLPSLQELQVLRALRKARWNLRGVQAATEA